MALTHAGSLDLPQYEVEKLPQWVRDQMDQMVRDSQNPGWNPPFPFDGSCDNVTRICTYASEWQSLDTLYNLPVMEERCHPLVNILNIQAIRNRFMLVKYLLARELLTLGEMQEPRILEVAAGSAQAVIEVMGEFRDEQGPKVQALLLDHNPSAFVHAQDLAARHNVQDKIQTVVGNALRPDKRLVEEFRPNLIEMVGLADYFNDFWVRTMLLRFHEWLPKGGVLMIGNVVVGNPEREFIERIYLWRRMVYRGTEDLRKLILEAGFSECTVTTEPHNIHAVAVARK